VRKVRPDRILLWSWCLIACLPDAGIPSQVWYSQKSWKYMVHENVVVLRSYWKSELLKVLVSTPFIASCLPPRVRQLLFTESALINLMTEKYRQLCTRRNSDHNIEFVFNI
jgi:hypothetical protein